MLEGTRLRMHEPKEGSFGVFSNPKISWCSKVELSQGSGDEVAVVVSSVIELPALGTQWRLPSLRFIAVLVHPSGGGCSATHTL